MKKEDLENFLVNAGQLIRGWKQGSLSGEWSDFDETVLKQFDELSPVIRQLEDSKNTAYDERNNLVAFLSRLYPSHLAKHPEEDKTWENDWRWIVCVHSPAGQMTWHIHDTHLEKFAHLADNALERGNLNDWDGHTTAEKYERLKKLPPIEITF